MRPINPVTGKAYPRNRAVNWERVRDALAWRKADRNLRAEGFVPLHPFQAFPWTNGHPDSHRMPRVVATAHHPDGQSVYVRMEYDR